MGWVSSLFRRKAPNETVKSFTLRQGKSVAVDEAFEAWTSGDLELMLKAVKSKTNPIDRHFLLQSIVGTTYKLRKEEKFRNLCIEYSEKHLEEFPELAPALKDEMGGSLPRITTFQNYATVLTENKNFDKAIDICIHALSYGLHDNTKSGFNGRIQRIEKMAQKKFLTINTVLLPLLAQERILWSHTHGQVYTVSRPTLSNH